MLETKELLQKRVIQPKWNLFQTQIFRNLVCTQRIFIFQLRSRFEILLTTQHWPLPKRLGNWNDIWFRNIRFDVLILLLIKWIDQRCIHLFSLGLCWYITSISPWNPLTSGDIWNLIPLMLSPLPWQSPVNGNQCADLAARGPYRSRL